MSERLEKWKAREKLRSDIGWAAIYVGLCGIWVVVVGVSLFMFAMTFEVESAGLPVPLVVGLVLALGLALLSCAVGLWNARAWARKVAAALFAVLLVQSVIQSVLNRSIDLWLTLWLFPVVYLLLPSTGRRFERVRGLQSMGVDPNR